MTKQEFQKLAGGTAPLFLDGATGTNLQQRGMPRGVCTELWVKDHPELITALQKEYVQAGSQVIYAPTFNCNPLSMEAYGLDKGETVKLNGQLVEICRRAVNDRALVAGDMTTVAKPMEPYGPLTYTQVYDSYCVQAEALARAGVDLLVGETMMGVEETVALAEAARNACDLPLLCSFSAASDGKCYFDGTVLEALPMLRQLGVDALGINCGSGPEQLANLIARICAETELPVIAKPNAGLPKIREDGQAVYDLGPEEFARQMQGLKEQGAKLLGGCCGTTPEHIRQMKALLG